MIVFRSHFSLLKGCLSPREACIRAKRSGFASLCLADVNNFYGLPEFYRNAREIGVVPIAGVSVVPPGVEPLLLVCLTKAGFATANRLVTKVLAHIAESEPFDICGLLVNTGWQGLCVASSDPATLLTLAKHTRSGLYCSLQFGSPFARLAGWAKQSGFPTLATTDAVWVGNAERRRYRLIRAVDLRTTVDNLPKSEFLGERQRFPAANELSRFFESQDQALKIWHTIEDRSLPLFGEGYQFPKFNGQSESESFRLLRSLCEKGVTKRYGGMRNDIRLRLDHELSIIGEKRFSGYFLVVWDIVARCPRTCGRGSSASSIVSFLLGITHVDPLEHNLFFERFLNRGRMDPPDIDVDFPWDERHKALRYVFHKYENRSAMVADHITFGPRSSMHEAARAYGLTEEESGRLVQHYCLGKLEQVPEYLRTAAADLFGRPRHIGTHPGGVVVTPAAITSYVHVQKSPLGLPVIAWEKDGAEDAGLVKIDLLGNRSLGVLRDCLELVNKKRRYPLDWHTLYPVRDAATQRLIESGDTLGVFYVESPATRQLLKKMERGDFEHLIVASSIIRPAASKYISEYISRLHGGGYETLHPLFEKTLKETLGIMVYQEDVARVAIAVCGFSPKEADGLRKALTRKGGAKSLAAYQKRFIDGGKSGGIPGRTLDIIWEMVRSFEGYSFCKAHSASYALVSYRLAWMKRHYPLEFMVSVINNGGGYYSRQVYLNNVRRMGFSIFAPDVNKSGLSYQSENGGMRMGLGQLREVSAECLERLLLERRTRGSFANFEDFLSRVRPARTDLRVFIRSGALDGISDGRTRPMLFFAAGRQATQNMLIELDSVPDFIGDYPQKTKILDEKRTLGLMVSVHQISLYGARIPHAARRIGVSRIIDSREIPEHVGKLVCIAGTVAAGKEVQTRANTLMCFLSFEDQHSIFETVLFPHMYENLSEDLDIGSAFLVSGVVQKEYGTFQILLRGLQNLAVE